MNVLEIYPNHSWWFEGRSSEDIELLREAAHLPSADEQSASLEKLAPARAFYLAGQAAAFDLIPGIFDDILICFEPTALMRMILEERIRTWISPSGVYRFEPVFHAEMADAQYDAAQEQGYLYRPLRRFPG